VITRASLVQLEAAAGRFSGRVGWLTHLPSCVALPQPLEKRAATRVRFMPDLLPHTACVVRCRPLAASRLLSGPCCSLSVAVIPAACLSDPAVLSLSLAAVAAAMSHSSMVDLFANLANKSKRPDAEASVTPNADEDDLDERSGSSCRKVCIYANIHDILSIEPEKGLWSAKGSLTTRWELNDGDINKFRRESQADGNEAQALRDESPMLEQIQETLDKEARKNVNRLLWSPRPYFRNLVEQKFDTAFRGPRVTHNVTPQVNEQQRFQSWRVERKDEFYGYFKLNLLAEESDQAHPLKEVCLAIEVCSTADVTELPKFSVLQPRDGLPRPWGCVNPSEFALKHAWFLEGPTPYEELYAGDSWLARQSELTRTPRWVDQPHGMEDLPLLAVAARESTFTSRFNQKYATFQMRMQAVHTSDTRHYRPEFTHKSNQLKSRAAKRANDEEKANQREVRIRTNVMQIDEIDLKKVHLQP
jgi:hypothetical protein